MQLWNFDSAKSLFLYDTAPLFFRQFHFLGSKLFDWEGSCVFSVLGYIIWVK